MLNKNKTLLITSLYVPIGGAADFLFIEYIAHYIDPINLVFMRLVLLAVFFLIIHKRVEGLFRVDKKDIYKFGAAGALGYGIYYSLESIGIANTGAGLSSLLLATIPLFTLIGERLVYGKRITSVKLFSVLLSVLGVAVITIGLGYNGKLTSVIILLLAVMIYTIWIFIVKPLNEKYSPVTVTTGCFIAGTVTTLPICIINGKISEIVELPMESIIMVIIFSIFCLGIQQLTYIYVISKLSVTSSAVIINLLPFTTVIASWIFFHKVLSVGQLFGGVMIIFSLVILLVTDKADKSN